VAVTPSDVHGVARSLWQHGTAPKFAESCVRTVAGRAYYSAYLSTREAARAAYNDPSFDIGHQPLARFMIGSGSPSLKVAGLLLDELRVARELADYDMSRTLRHVDAEAFVDNAEDIIGLSGALRAEFAAHPRRMTSRSAT